MAETGNNEADFVADDRPLLPQAVGDSRRLQVFCIHPALPDSCVEVGTVWQGVDGQLHGSGLAAVMLFEPTIAKRYVTASIALDVSPLTVLYQRLSRSNFFLAEFEEQIDG